MLDAQTTPRTLRLRVPLCRWRCRRMQTRLEAVERSRQPDVSNVRRNIALCNPEELLNEVHD
jgi:hypothetical protein